MCPFAVGVMARTKALLSECQRRGPMPPRSARMLLIHREHLNLLPLPKW